VIYRNVLPYNIDRKSLAAGKPTKENGHGLLAEPLWSKGESRRDPWTVASAAVSRPSLRYIMDPGQDGVPLRLAKRPDQLGEDRQHHRRLPTASDLAPNCRLYRGGPRQPAVGRGAVAITVTLHGPPGFGPDVEAEVVLSKDTFSIRDDMDRQTGVISRRGHALEGCSLAGKIVYFPALRGGAAAGWAFLAGSRQTPGHPPGKPDPFTMLESGDPVRMSPARGVVELVAKRGGSG